MIKNFTQWHQVKTEIQYRRPPSFRERDVWWCNLGLNLGHEQDGKHDKFQRPVLVLRKFNQAAFLAVPLTSQIREHPYHFSFSFHGEQRGALISQVRLLDALRLMRYMGRMQPDPFDVLREAVCDTIKNTRPRR